MITKVLFETTLKLTYFLCLANRVDHDKEGDLKNSAKQCPKKAPENVETENKLTS